MPRTCQKDLSILPSARHLGFLAIIKNLAWVYSFIFLCGKIKNFHTMNYTNFSVQFEEF